MTIPVNETGHVTVPVGELDGVRVERFVIPEHSFENLYNAIHGGRDSRPGEYTRLLVDGRLWMSDVDAEWRDHLEAVWRIRQPETRRVLINGLGLGMVVQAALDQPHVEHVDVVELDRRVVDLVGPHYLKDPRVTIHHADAYTVTWPANTRWDVAWHDVWKDMNQDNLPLMAKLHRRYGRRVGWQGSWGKEQLEYDRRRDRSYGW